MSTPSIEELQAEIHSLRQQLEKSNLHERTNETLFQIASALSSCATIEELFTAIHQILSQVIDTTNFFIALYDGNRKIITFPYEVDVVEVDPTPLDATEQNGSLSARILATKKPLLITKAEIRQLQEETGEKIISGYPPEIWLGVPLISRNNLIGVMAVQSYEGPTFYDNSDKNLLSAAAAGVALAIERKKIEQELSDTSRRYRDILQNVSEIAIYGYDENRKTTFWNGASERLYGFRAEEVIGKELDEFLLPDVERDRTNKLHHEAFNKGKIPSGERVLKDKLGNTVPIFSSPIVNESPHGRELFCFDLDLRPIKQVEESLKAAIAQFEAAMNALDAVVYVADMESYELLFMNDYTRKIYNARVGDICWKVFQGAIDGPCSFCTNNRLIDEAGKATKPFIWEVQNQKTQRWFQCRDQAIRWPDGRMVRLEIAFDITHRKKMEQNISESELRFKTLNEASFGGICIHENGHILDCNSALGKITGYSIDDLKKMTCFELIKPEFHGLMAEKISESIGEPYDVIGITKDGVQYDLRLQGKEIPFEGKIVRVAEFRDITLRRKTEIRLEENLRRHRVIFENSPLGMIYFDQDGSILDCNEKFLKLSGAGKSSVLGNKTLFHIHTHLLGALKRALTGRKTLYNGVLHENGGVSGLIVRVIFNPVQPGQNPTKVIATVEDITEQQKAEIALRESADRFKMFFGAISDAIFVHPFAEEGFNTFIEVNDIACKRYGYSRGELLSMSPADLNSDKQITDTHGAKEHRKRLLESSHMIFEAVHRTKEGVDFPVEINANIIHQKGRPVILSVVRDISERKNAEEEKSALELQLLQAQKLESIGRLAGGVAHDFNNMLGVILGRVEFIREDSDADIHFLDDVLEIEKAAHRSANLTRQLLAFARKQNVHPKAIFLSEIVKDTLSMLQRLIGEKIELSFTAEENIRAIKIDPVQVDQILTNFCINSKDAISGNGHIEITVSNRDIGRESRGIGIGVLPGKYVELAVEDDGCGMGKETIKNLFEPFFTTKSVGKGTGLGLATVYGIVKQNNGYIYVNSSPGEGSCFKVLFPCYQEHVEEISVSNNIRLNDRSDITILVVEDEESILALTRTMLERQGYTSLGVNSPIKAIELVKEHSGSIDLILTDVIMPEMDGKELALEIAKIYPDTQTLYMSGYTDDVLAESGIMGSDLNFIQKPFTKAELQKKVQEVLERQT